jgi:HlyD family secretion protein
MTADCSIVTNRKEDILRVPSAAIRFNPASFIPMEEAKPAAGAKPPAGATGANVVSRGLVARHEEKLWVLVNGKPRPVSVKAGVSDGMFTEVSGDGVSEGMVVLTGIEDYKKAANAGGGSPLGGAAMHH